MRPISQGFARSAALLGLASFALAAGCGQQTLAKTEVEEQVKSELTKKVGQAPKEIRCPGDLDAKKGAKTRCTLIADDGSEIGVAVRVTRLEDDKAIFDIEVDDKVRSK